eukprot:GHUV01021685.1.p1 GENE.GHUV01021685.1~~GHUV01021685.1.p1  ORF type:complete len:136 (+),score=58.03 GHUV01021685.1:194-601(+)
MAETAATEAAKPQPEAEKAVETATQPAAEQTAAVEQPADSKQEEAAADSGPQIQFKIQYGKNSADLKRPASSTIAELKAEIEKTLSIPPSMQKLMYKGLLKNDTDTLEKVGIKNGAKVMLIGSRLVVAVTGEDGA